jgi:hypothetical protein
MNQSPPLKESVSSPNALGTTEADKARAIASIQADLTLNI